MIVERPTKNGASFNRNPSTGSVTYYTESTSVRESKEESTVDYKGFTIEVNNMHVTYGKDAYDTQSIFIRKGNNFYVPVRDNRESDGPDWIEEPCDTVDDAKKFIDNMGHATYKRITL